MTVSPAGQLFAADPSVKIDMVGSAEGAVAVAETKAVVAELAMLVLLGVNG